MGWLYGSIAEDILTRIKIHSKGWKSILLLPNPPAFLGLALTGGPEALTQRKRWVTGSLEILVSKNSSLLAFYFTRLSLKQRLAYIYFLIRSLYAIPKLTYAILPAYVILTNSHFLPSVSSHFDAGFKSYLLSKVAILYLTFSQLFQNKSFT